jgi:competence protein ComEA
MLTLRSLFQRVVSSAWAPIVGKAVAGVAALSVLALFGSGAFDGLIEATPAQARPSPRASAPVPRPSATPTTVASTSASAAASVSARVEAPRSAVLPDGRLVLNEATAAEIDKLPGIGLKKAEAIVLLRTKLGGKFRRLEDITRVRGIKRKALDRLRPHLVLDRPLVSP